MVYRFFTLLICLLLATSAVAQEVYRWVDENGEVHFSESLPAEYADMDHEVISASGIVIERVQRTQDMVLVEDLPGPQPDTDLQQTTPQLSERDEYLLSSFGSVAQLADALDQEIQRIQIDRRLIQQSQANAMNTYTAFIRQAAQLERAGLNITDDRTLAITDLRQRLLDQEHSLELLDIKQMETRASYQTDIDRYTELTQVSEE